MRALAYHNLFLRILCVFLAPSITGVGAFAGRQIESTARRNDKVVIRQRTIILKRGVKGRDYKEAIVKIPQIAGISDPDPLRKVRAILDLKNIFGDSLEGIRSAFKESSWLSDWLEEITYKVNYNANYILDIRFFKSGVGNYPWTFTEHRLINLKTGALLKAADVFKSASLDALVMLVEGAMRAELREEIKRNGQDDSATEWLGGTLREAKFSVENLDNFSVNNKGVTFLYDFGFPHALKALEPSGRFFFSYERLKEHIKRDGLLGGFVR